MGVRGDPGSTCDLQQVFILLYPVTWWRTLQVGARVDDEPIDGNDKSARGNESTEAKQSVDRQWLLVSH